MSDWTAGHAAELDYTFGYYAELNPLRLRLAFLNMGLAMPEIGTACELGFGQGLSANIHAAASVTQWYGTDFSPAQAAFAQELATASGSGARLYDDAFADFCHRPDLPDFDYIGLHGIWSWVSDDNRKIIVDFVRRKLKVGGVLYISYNTQPGWATFAPMRHVLAQHADIMSAKGQGMSSRIDGALEFAEKLIATNPEYAAANPQIADRISKMKGQNRHYLAHDYFNGHWEPTHFSSMSTWLSAAKLTYACSAYYLDHADILNLTSEQQAFLRQIPDPMFRETVRDFIVNQQFRRDYWVKGVRKQSSIEQIAAMREQKVILITHRADVPTTISGPLGEANVNEALCGPVLDVLADHKVWSLADIEHAVQGKQVSFSQMIQAIMVLGGGGHLRAVQDNTVVAAAKVKTDKLNAYLINKARGSADIHYLASPLTGGGIAVDRIAQLFLLAISEGMQEQAQWVRFAWQILAAQKQLITREGRSLATAEENLAELTTQARTFAEKQLPVLRALQVAPEQNYMPCSPAQYAPITVLRLIDHLSDTCVI